MVALHEDRHEIGIATVATPLSESVAAIAVIVLAILGLANVAPHAMAAIATIVVGGAILLMGAQMVGEFTHLASTGGAATNLPGSWMGGLSLEFLAGGAGIVLGILALFSNTPALTPAALVVFGGTLLLNGSLVTRRALIAPSAAASPQDATAAAIAAQMAELAGGGQVLIGIAALVLGILALIPIHGEVLTLVGLLAVGASLLMSGTASSGAMASAKTA